VSGSGSTDISKSQLLDSQFNTSDMSDMSDFLEAAARGFVSLSGSEENVAEGGLGEEGAVKRVGAVKSPTVTRKRDATMRVVQVIVGMVGAARV